MVEEFQQPDEELLEGLLLRCSQVRMQTSKLCQPTILSPTIMSTYYQTHSIFSICLHPHCASSATLLTRGHAPQELPSLSGMELSMSISALAKLRYRPSDAWLAAFSAEARRRLPVLRNQDLGLIVTALAELAAPLDPAWLSDLEREAGNKWWSMDLDAMTLVLHGLSQYGRR